MPDDAAEVTAEQVAAWMLAELERSGYLEQASAVYEIAQKFGYDFVVENERGNPGISPKVLTAFTKLTKHSVVWLKAERAWRRRRPGDAPGRQQSYS